MNEAGLHQAWYKETKERTDSHEDSARLNEQLDIGVGKFGMVGGPARLACRVTIDRVFFY